MAAPLTRPAMSPIPLAGRPLLAALALSAVPAAAQAPLVSEPESREAVSLTVYSQPAGAAGGGFAVVREVRPLVLRDGVQAVRFEGVPAQIDPTSLSLASLTAPGSLSVLEQNYQYNLIGTNSVLDAAVGQRVRVVRDVGDRVVADEGVLVSQPGQGRIVRLDDGRVLVDPEGTIELLTLPDGLLSRPSLLWRLAADRAGAQRVEARYLTDGLGWKADYVAVVDEAETAVDLTGWVTLTNESGATYPEAGLQLIAGDVRRVQPQREQFYTMREEAVQARMAAPPQQEAFFEYHLYTFPTPTTIEDRETKQLELLSAADVGTTRRLVVDASGNYFPFYRRPRPARAGRRTRSRRRSSWRSRTPRPTTWGCRSRPAPPACTRPTGAGRSSFWARTGSGTRRATRPCASTSATPSTWSRRGARCRTAGSTTRRAR